MKEAKYLYYSVPVYAVACVFTIIAGWAADKYRRRGIFNIIGGCIAVAGYAILLGSKNYKLSYAATFLAAIGVYPCIPNTITWVSNNTEGVYKRGFVLGLVIGWGSKSHIFKTHDQNLHRNANINVDLNGVMSSNVYQGRDGPWYRPGHLVILLYLAVCLLIGSILNYFLLMIENKKRVNGRRDAWVDGLNDKEIEDRGDLRPDFIYTL